MDITKATAEKVAAARLDAGVSLQHLAEATGIPYATLHRKITGRSSFDLDQLAAVANALGVDPRDLLPFEDAA